MFRKTLFISLLLLVSVFSLAQTETKNKPAVAEQNAQLGFNDSIDRLADDFIEAYLSIAEPGDYLYTTLGHAAFHLKCPTFDLDYYFSMEGENRPDAVWQFLAGKLKMGLVCVTAAEYLETYRAKDRGVTEYKLNLTPMQEIRFWELLDNYVQTWQDMPYDYYHRSCAMALVDVFNELVGIQNIHYAEPWSEKFKHTPGEFVYYQLRESNPWTLSFLRLIAGNEVDKKVSNDRKFLVPADLAETWQKATIDGKYILEAEPIVVLPSTIQYKKTWCTPELVAIILLILAVFSACSICVRIRWMKILGTVIDYTILSIVTLLGLFMSYLIFVSNLPCTEWNWLIITFNPLPALAWYWSKYWALPYAGLMIVWIIGALCAPYMIAYSEHLILTSAFAVVLIKQWKFIKCKKI